MRDFGRDPMRVSHYNDLSTLFSYS
jgi:hypothetical protein